MPNNYKLISALSQEETPISITCLYGYYLIPIAVISISGCYSAGR